MTNSILIMGSSGAGKTSLGKMVASALGCSYVDIDEYIWRQDTAIPFTAMYPKEEKIARLKAAIFGCERFVMAGSMNSFHQHFDPYFKLVVHLHAEAQTRVRRVHLRELEQFGSRILEGGDMYEDHQQFLRNVAGYDDGLGGCTLQQHEAWLSSLSCKVLRLNGADALEANAKTILKVYQSL